MHSSFIQRANVEVIRVNTFISEIMRGKKVILFCILLVMRKIIISEGTSIFLKDF